jgi:hypothetical protein
MIAGDVFRTVPRYTPFQHADSGDNVFGTFATSFSRDISVESSDDRLLYTRTLDWDCLPFHPGVQEIVGVGNSPEVSYDGTGSYFIHIKPKEISVHVFPDVITGDPPYLGLIDGTICQLDETTPHTMELRLPGWGDNCVAWKVTPQGRTPIPITAGKLALTVTAGDYIIERKD